MDPLFASLKVAGSGLAAQSTRLRVVSENLANALSSGKTAGADPYRRKTVTFNSELDRASGVALVRTSAVGVDRSPFNVEYDPGNPAADSNGNVTLPNVNMIVEMSDMREANRAYEADLQTMKQTRDLLSMTIDLLKG
ncbi:MULTISPECIES: flagellar basal body rod protein FlgC [Methylocystis]|uniref:Flagellar basal-body rod protein FlgC n=1 Tax=Methylocystis iwaonis TaxID=2885079 RepID=A0ABM8E5B3_9HYPH|nr:MULTISPECIES: flagellar basal body rod protein FlgC [Methylocystis]MBL1258662.1 flagellar basal body rod protein FlgC [Methylocystis sp. Sn-Cys]MDJ0449456.1 flagellar basal body rod protein FlgC [Methylocystis sp. JR02]BDV33002.1 flagellar basal-body rod protein FlgC [Methylocystis iwaonis]